MTQNKWVPKNGDIVCFKGSTGKDKSVYKIIRMWCDEGNTVEITRLIDSDLNKALIQTLTHPILRHVSMELLKVVHDLIHETFPTYNWEFDEVENDVITTQLNYLDPAGKTLLKT